MLSDALLKAIQEVMRRSQAGTTSLSDLAQRLCMLLRVTAITSPNPRGAVVAVRDKLAPFVPEICLLEALVGRVLEVMEGDDTAREAIEPELDALLDEVREAHAELAEQASTLIADSVAVAVLAEPEGGVVEAALRDAAEVVCDEAALRNPIQVSLVRIAPDADGVADAMGKRLGDVRGLDVRVVQDVEVTETLYRGATKVVLATVALDKDDGGLCLNGARLLCAAASRLKVPVVLLTPRHRMMPKGNSSVATMASEMAPPGVVWAYEEARDDRKHEAISVVANVYDLIPLHRCDMVVTEYGGYSPEYVETLVPNFEHTIDESTDS